MRTNLLLVFLLVFGVAIPAVVTTSCGPSGPTAVIGQTTIDCTTANLASVASLFSDLKSKILNGGSWTAVENDAKSAGAAIGGCALVALVQDYLGSKGSAPDKASGKAAHDALEHFRANVAGGATFHTTACAGSAKVCDL